MDTFLFGGLNDARLRAEGVATAKSVWRSLANRQKEKSIWSACENGHFQHVFRTAQWNRIAQWNWKSASAFAAKAMAKLLSKVMLVHMFVWCSSSKKIWKHKFRVSRFVIEYLGAAAGDEHMPNRPATCIPIARQNLKKKGYLYPDLLGRAEDLGNTPPGVDPNCSSVGRSSDTFCDNARCRVAWFLYILRLGWSPSQTYTYMWYELTH